MITKYVAELLGTGGKGAGTAFDFAPLANGALPAPLSGAGWAISSGMAVNTPALGSNLYQGGKGTFDTTTESWQVQGTNAIASVAGELRITYVDSSQGAYCYFSAVKDLQSNLVVGTWYRLDFDAYVNATSSVAVGVSTADVNSITITNTVKQSFHIVFRASNATSNYVYAYSMGAGEIVYLDNLVLRAITLANGTAFCANKIINASFNVKASLFLGVGEQAGVAWADSASNPQNMVVAFYDLQRGKATVIKYVAGSPTTLIDTATTYADGAMMEIRRTAATTVQIWYGATQVGTDQTVGDAAILTGNYYGMFSTGPLSNIGSFYAGAPLLGIYPVVYLGDSITYGSYASVIDKLSYRGLTGFYLDRHYLKYGVTKFNKGVVGTTSWYGLVRLQADVIANNPELVVLALSINDTDNMFFHACGEAMIRRLRAALPNAKLVYVAMLYLTNRVGNDPTSTKAGVMAAYQALCSLYKVPFVDWAAQVITYVQQGTYTLVQLYQDNAHPNDLGHSLLAALAGPQMARLGQGAQYVGALPNNLYGDGTLEVTPIARNGDDNNGETGTWTGAGYRQSIVANSTIQWTGTFQSWGWDVVLQVGTGRWNVDGGGWTGLDFSGSGGPGQMIGNFARGTHTITIIVDSGTFRINKFYAI